MIARITSEVLVALRDNPLTPVVIAVGLGAIWIAILLRESRAGKAIPISAPPLAQLTSTTTVAPLSVSSGTGDGSEDAGNDTSTDPVIEAQAASLPTAASLSSADVHAGEAEVSRGDADNSSVHGGGEKEMLSPAASNHPTSISADPVAVGIARAVSSPMPAAAPPAVDDLDFDPLATVTFEFVKSGDS